MGARDLQCTASAATSQVYSKLDNEGMDPLKHPRRDV